MRNTLTLCALALLLAGWGLPRAAALDTEIEARNEFVKAYNGTGPAARLEAVAKLKGLHEPASLQMIYKVATVDQDPVVRKAAFTLLCELNDKDGYVARLAAAAFDAEKDRDARKELATLMSTLKFRHDPVKAFAHYLTTLRYPPLPDTRDRNNQGGGSQYGMGSSTTSREVAAATRKHFEEILVIFNAMAGSSFKADYDTPAEIKKWWPTKQAEFLKKDMELRQQLAEAPKPEEEKKQ
ncbi:MAG: hypothetical protein M5U26_06500 [Planctomycetota bacterium]|nr:hypothetical protein [Planctomycetota bacterium]